MNTSLKFRVLTVVAMLFSTSLNAQVQLPKDLHDDPNNFSSSQPKRFTKVGDKVFFIGQELLHPPKDEHQDSSNALLIRPNPTRSDLRIQFSTEVKNLDCMIYDLMGRVVVQTTLNGVETTLHLNHLVAGQYIVRVEGHSTQKFIKY